MREALTSSRQESKKCRRDFAVMCWTLAINHATVTTPILYASSVLDKSTGEAGNAMLYGATLVCSLFFSTLIYGILGSKRGLSLSMGLYCVYVGFFATAALICEKDPASCGVHGKAYWINLAGAFIGGTGAGLLWTCQGAFFSSICERVALAEDRETPDVTAELAGNFALIFLAMEAAVRASATLLTKYAGLDFAAVFYIFSGLALVSALAFQVLATETNSVTPSGSLCAKATSAIRLWKDPKLWVLQCTNLTFGFAAAWLAGYVGSQIVKPALGAQFIGFAGAMLSALASALSAGLGIVARKLGKGPVVALGAAAFLLLAVLSKYVGHPATWGWGVLVFYVLMGIGRAVYECTNKAIFADFFPGEASAGAFANVFVFGTLASTIAFSLGASSKDLSELYLLMIFAILTVPGYLTASFVKRCEEASLHDADCTDTASSA